MYSQSREEEYILGALGDSVGSLIDIGAYDGKTFSNSLALIERGYSGLLVEPSAHAFGELLKRHGANDKLRLVHSLVGLRRGIVPFWNSDDAISTTEAASYARWKEVGKFRPLCYVPQLTVEDLMREFPAFSHATFVSIDTEGTSAQLFLAWPFHICVPSVFCVEHDSMQDAIIEIAAPHGYKLIYENTENVILAK